MTQMLKQFDRNTAGRDFAVGDIHGAFSKLERALDSIEFDRAVDRLFSVGDLVDRGPENERADEFLNYPWFHAIQGNHEDIAIRFAKGNDVDRAIYARNGGQWFMDLPALRQQEMAAAFAELPYAMEVQTEKGLVGMVHAEPPTKDWTWLGEELLFNRAARDCCQWARTRIERLDTTPVLGCLAVIVGHTPVKEPVALGNVFYIDTLAWQDAGHFTFMDLATLHAIEVK